MTQLDRAAALAPHAQPGRKAEMTTLPLAMTLIGGALAIVGLSRGVRQLPVTAAGAALVYYGLSRNPQTYKSLGLRPLPNDDGMVARHTVTINRPAEAVFASFADVARWPEFMQGVTDAAQQDQMIHWTLAERHWEANITNLDVPHSLSYRTSDNAPFQYEATLTLRPEAGGQRTIVTWLMTVDQTPGLAKLAASAITGVSPIRNLRGDLRRFKQLLETGQILTTEGQPSGRK